MPRLLRLPPPPPPGPRKRGEDPESLALLEKVTSLTRHLEMLHASIAQISAERGQVMAEARGRGVSLRKIAVAARMASPQTVLNHLPATNGHAAK